MPVDERPITFVDVLVRAVAESQLEEFMSDDRLWQQFVLRAKQEPEFEELFKYVSFDLTDADSPYSSEADHALHVLTQARLISQPNLGHEVTTMNSSQRQRVKEDKPQGMRAYSDAVQRLALAAREILTPV